VGYLLRRDTYLPTPFEPIEPPRYRPVLLHRHSRLHEPSRLQLLEDGIFARALDAPGAEAISAR